MLKVFKVGFGVEVNVRTCCSSKFMVELGWRRVLKFHPAISLKLCAASALKFCVSLESCATGWLRLSCRLGEVLGRRFV